MALPDSSVWQVLMMVAAVCGDLPIWGICWEASCHRLTFVAERLVVLLKEAHHPCEVGRSQGFLTVFDAAYCETPEPYGRQIF